MHDLIELLKNNRYQWGMWLDPDCYGPELGAAMQTKAREIGYQYFKHYDYLGNWREHANLGEFDNLTCYHLRADYAEEQKIVECEIKNQENDLCWFNDSSNTWWALEQAMHFSNFIGFKFEDGVIRPVPVVYTPRNAAISCCWDVKAGNMAAYAVLHATSVLFRRQK